MITYSSPDASVILPDIHGGSDLRFRSCAKKKEKRNPVTSEEGKEKSSYIRRAKRELHSGSGNENFVYIREEEIRNPVTSGWKWKPSYIHCYIRGVEMRNPFTSGEGK